MRILVVVSAEATAEHSRRLAEMLGIWAGRGHEHAVYPVDGPAEYGVLLDVILEAQPDAVLLSGMDGDDALVRSVVDVVWKFDNNCRVLLDGARTAVAGVVAMAGSPEDVAGAATGQAAQPTAEAGPGTAALLVSRGWARGTGRYLPTAAVAQIRAAIDACDRDGLTVTDGEGYRHAVGVVRYAPSLLGLLDDRRLGALVQGAIGTTDLWLGALECLVPQSSHAWRRELAVPLLAAGSSSFRPGLSVLVALDDDGSSLGIHQGSHRLRGQLVRDPRDPDRVVLGCGEVALVEAGCRFRLAPGPFLHLRFIRGWMKPDILLAGVLQDRADQLGEQARQWCGIDVGLPTSVEEFLRIEEAALAGSLTLRKGSGI